MSYGGPSSLRIAVVGGGPAASFFALYALRYASEAGRDVSITLYEGKDFRRHGPVGCNMCAGIVPAQAISRFHDLGLDVPAELVLSRIRTYSLHTSAGSLDAIQPDPGAEIISVYRGAGPKYGRASALSSFDEFLVEEAVSRGALLRRSFVEAVRRGSPVEVEAGGESERYDLVVLASGVNGRPVSLHGFGYRPPPAGSMVQSELYLGPEEVERRLGSSVHIFLPPDDIASYGILIPKGPYVTVSLLGARDQVRSLSRFLDTSEVKALLGDQARRVCGCRPRISLGPAAQMMDDGFVAIGDASVTRLYKNGIGSAMATAERAAWTAIHRGVAREDFLASYLPLCRSIHNDNRVGWLLFLQVPMLKRFGPLARAHQRLVARAEMHQRECELHARILWGMFTGAYSYREMLRMAVSPRLVLRMGLALGRSLLPGA